MKTAWLLFFVTACIKQEPTPLYPPGEGDLPETEYNWATIADSLQESTYNTFIASNNHYYKQSTSNNTFHYWWNAHMLDVLVDGYQRTESDTYVTRMNNLLNGYPAMNHGVLTNDYYDDMEWLALSALRGYDETGANSYREAVEVLWEDIKGGKNDHQGGGIAWRKSQLDYKNTPANAPAIILACRLYERFGATADLDIAVELYQWLKGTLVDPVSGIVWDGINRNGDGEIDRNWLFTYNQGVFIGAALSLFEVTGERMYLDDAVRTANAAVNSSDIVQGGILKVEGQGDGGLFKGIMVRYLTQLAMEPAVNDADRSRFIGVLRFNAETAYNNALVRPDMLIGPNWNARSQDEVELSTHLSGVMLMEAMALLDASGLL